MQNYHHFNKKKAQEKASFDSEDEGDFIADEQAQIHNDHSEFYDGTQEHDQGQINGIHGFVTPTAFIDKSQEDYRKNRFIQNNNLKLKSQKNQTAQNSQTRKEKLNIASISPKHPSNLQQKNMAFVSAQKPTIQNLPPSIVLSSKQVKLNSTTQIKGSKTMTNSFVNSKGQHQKNKHSFTGDGQNINALIGKSSPIAKAKIVNKHHNSIQVNYANDINKQSFNASQSNNGSENFHVGSAYNTLNQKIKTQIQMQKNKKIEAQKAQNLVKSQKNMAIKTKCVSLDVSQDRESENNSPSSYFATNMIKNKVIVNKIQNVQGLKMSAQLPVNSQTGTLKIKRKPMQSHTMNHSKQTSLNNTPTRPFPMAFKTPNDSKVNLNSNYLNPQGSIEYANEIQNVNLMSSQNQEKMFPDSVHNIQFTRNTQTNAKTVSNVAQVLQPQKDTQQNSKKNLSLAKSVALSIENSDANLPNSRANSIYTSLTHLNKNINLRMDKKVSQGEINNDESKSKCSSSRDIQVTNNQSQKNSYKGVQTKGTKKLKTVTQSIEFPKQLENSNNLANSHSQLAINSIGKTNNNGVSFTKNNNNKGFVEQISVPKNMNIHDSMNKKTIGLRSKMNFASAAEPQTTNLTKPVNSKAQTINKAIDKTRIIPNYVSKTAQVSAYASKNNSNNSSLVRNDSNHVVGQRFSSVLKKKKPQLGFSQDNDQPQQKQSSSNFNIGNSSLSLKDKQISFNSNAKKQNLQIKTNQFGDTNSNVLKQVTNDHHIQSTKSSNMYATVGSKTVKNANNIVKKGLSGAKNSGTGQSISQSQNFISMSSNTLNAKNVKKLTGNMILKNELREKDVHRSANSSLSKQRLLKNGQNLTGNIRMTKKVTTKPASKLSSANQSKVNRNTIKNESEDDQTSNIYNQEAQIYSSSQSKGTSSMPKKQLQPSQAKNSMRNIKESYRRAGYSSVNVSNSPSERAEETPINSFSNNKPNFQINNKLFQFNDIQEEMKETESYHDLNLNAKTSGCFNTNLKAELNPHQQKETPKSTKKKINYEDTENSVMIQLQEYKKDINNLKHQIIQYFKQYGEMQCSTNNFYRIGRVLGRGAFGKVNLACHKVTEHMVAIKALEKKVLDNEKRTKKRVMQEIAILKQSNHQNVVRLYDSFETQKHICFVMELCQGGDLLSYVRKRRKLKEDNAKYLFKQLIEGLHYIHTKKFVIHRDIKLDNVLLDASGRIKICDFGVSKQVKSDKERMYEQCGTPAYIAPEVSNKQRGYRGFKADMWSAGVCLYVMLIGTVPFKANSMKELYELMRKGKYSLQGEIISNEAKNLLSSLINVNSHKRLSAYETLQHPWFKMSQDGKEKMNYDREDLSQIIFTQKEIETIQKDYITRLEKLKKQRLKRENHSTLIDRDTKTGNFPVNNTTTFDEDYLFTEHNLDTKEDQKQEIFDKEKDYQNLFDKKDKQEFQKFEGLIMKKPVQNEFSPDEEKNLSEKSIIFCPFNSSFSNFDEDHPELFDWPDSVKEILQPKKSKIIKFSKKCRDLNREYECNNNADLDNGVYNAFVNEQELEAEKNQRYQNLSQEDEMMPTQSLMQSSSDSLNDSQNMSYVYSELDDIIQKGKAPMNSFVQNEISIYESMQKGHQNQWVVMNGMKTQTQNIELNEQLVNFTVDLFKHSKERSAEVYQKIQTKLTTGLQTQELNYLTAAYYLAQKYDRQDEE